jgi:quinol monooxygenase YgiN
MRALTGLPLVAGSALFAQHLNAPRAKRVRAARLIEKFLESAEIQRSNPACLLMMVSQGRENAQHVVLTEIWTNEESWEAARSSPTIVAWSAEMPELVERLVSSERLIPRGTSGLRHEIGGG